MQLGTFSLSLAVSDLAASRSFYQALGFEVVFGEAEQNWLIMRNGNSTIGLFQGMFDGNIMTFNPGWDDQAQPLTEFTDVFSIQDRLKAQGIEFVSEASREKPSESHFMIKDPDGNMILVDQHV